MHLRFKATGIFTMTTARERGSFKDSFKDSFTTELLDSAHTLQEQPTGTMNSFFRDGKPDFIKIGPLGTHTTTEIWEEDSEEGEHPSDIDRSPILVPP